MRAGTRVTGLGPSSMYTRRPTRRGIEAGMLVTSRSYQEYLAFFALTPADLEGRILDCSAGASGFAAEAAARGADVTAVDPAYEAPVEALVTEVADSNQRGNALVDQHDDRFTWSWYGTPEHRDAMRAEALAVFIEDVRATPERYVTTS